jgi:outer membrane immunogenic protein
MRRLALALGLIGLAGRAFAADYPLPPIASEPIAYVPAFPTYFRWQGFYVGGHFTAGDANADFTNSTRPLINFSLRELALEAQAAPSTWPVLGATDTRSVGGLGGYAGYNLQFDNAIIGVELNYTHSAFNAVAPSSPIERVVSAGGNTYDVTLTASGSMSIQDFATLRARLGWSADNFMPYATLGVAAGRADIALTTNVSGTQTGPNPNPPPATLVVPFSFTQSVSKSSAFLFGYAAGTGVDVALTSHLFARAEYEYIQFMPVSQITSHIHVGRAGIGLKF